jgi:hypothetical protein
MKLNVFERLNEIKKELGYLQKDKKVESYMAVTHDAVTAHTRGLFTQHGVMVIPSEKTSATIMTSMLTGKGNPYVRFEATFEVTFVNINEPDDRTSVMVTAHALDTGDKAPGKALSYATKYAILKVLQLETGEDEESRVASDTKQVDVAYWRKALTEASGKEGKAAIWKLFSFACREAGDIDSHNLLKDEMAAAKKEQGSE